jgi:hypothetical protein
MGMEPAREHPGDHLFDLVDDLGGRVPSRHLVVAESRRTVFEDLVVIDAQRHDRQGRDPMTRSGTGTSWRLRRALHPGASRYGARYPGRRLSSGPRTADVEWVNNRIVSRKSKPLGKDSCETKGQNLFTRPQLPIFMVSGAAMRHDNLRRNRGVEPGSDIVVFIGVRRAASSPDAVGL